MQASRRVRATIAAAFAVLFGVFTSTASAHPGFSATALVKIDASGELFLTLRHDALAFALDESSLNIADAPMFELLDASDDVQTENFAAARDRFLTLFALLADGKRVDIEILECPTATALHTWMQSHPDRRLPVKLDFVARAKLPRGSGSISFQFPQVLGDVIVTIDCPGVEPMAFPMRLGETTPSIEWAATNTADQGRSACNNGESRPSPGATIRHMSQLDVAGRYVVLGFTHIIPAGADHALFVLGLFLFSPRFKALLWQITAFTIAHSITLTLTTLHVVTISSIIIETTIAASIAFIGVENIVATKVRAWRPVVASVFGLVHGMGFASALSEIGLPTGQLVAGLVSFNVGVECGHLTVLTAAFLLLGWWRDKPWYRRRVAIPFSLVIATIALVWVVQRLAGSG